jgi:hypothetical protein|tara:strand:- start:340 stop:837 length:498 start_codon:yes stop_codon:yes gene_type:complete
VSQYYFGHVLRIQRDINGAVTTTQQFQNFKISQNFAYTGSDGVSRSYGFAPFGFSGVTVNRSGDGLEATLVFPNNSITRSWAVDAIELNYVMEVDVLITDESAEESTFMTAHNYAGQVMGGQWDNTSLNIQLGTVLDAVGTDVPRRSLTRQLVGNLPLTNNVRLR